MSNLSPAQDFQQKIKGVLTSQAQSGAFSQDESVLSSSPQTPHLQLSDEELTLKSMAKVSTSDKLELLENVINEIESSRQTAGSQTSSPPEPQLESNSLNINPPTQAPVGAVTPARKESEGGVVNLAEQSASIQYVEEEKSPELSPEVEAFIQEVQSDQDKALKEVVIADDQTAMPADDQYVSERVVVLPITPEVEKQGKKKTPKFSVRWLVEWSRKIVKMFQGKVIYREV